MDHVTDTDAEKISHLLSVFRLWKKRFTSVFKATNNEIRFAKEEEKLFTDRNPNQFKTIFGKTEGRLADFEESSEDYQNQVEFFKEKMSNLNRSKKELLQYKSRGKKIVNDLKIVKKNPSTGALKQLEREIGRLMGLLSYPTVECFTLPECQQQDIIPLKWKDESVPNQKLKKGIVMGVTSNNRARKRELEHEKSESASEEKKSKDAINDDVQHSMDIKTSDRRLRREPVLEVIYEAEDEEDNVDDGNRCFEKDPSMPQDARDETAQSDGSASEKSATQHGSDRSASSDTEFED